MEMTISVCTRRIQLWLVLVIFALCIHLSQASKKSHSKNVSPTCIQKVQKDMDCILGDGEWVTGKFVEYEYIKLLQKSGWEGCNRPILDYVWSFSPSCAKINLKRTYSRAEMCEILREKTIMIVGDSINNQFFVTLASALWPPELTIKDENFQHYDKCVLKDENGVVTSNYGDTGNNNLGITIPCEDMKHSFRLIFVRNFNLTVNTETPRYYFEGDGQLYKDIPRVWVDKLEEEKVDYLVMNRGAHFSRTIVDDLRETFTYITEKYPHLKIIWRNTPTGHADCGDTLQAAPLKKQPDVDESNPAFHWNSFAKFNTQIRQMIQRDFPQVLYLNFSNPTQLRSDSHISGDDCLHYCIPGPINNWVTWLMDALLIFGYHHC